MDQTLLSIAKSWCRTESAVNPTDGLLEWIARRNEEVSVEIRKVGLGACGDWFYDEAEGCIHNQGHTFFSVCGLRHTADGTVCEQPILLQREIGYLGIICREFDGVMHFLMQAKIEPGNVNKIQLSPTLQATRSNFTRKHGGAAPPYLEYFLNADRYEVVVDQLQSEQSSRFLNKRNRNILIRVEEDIPVLPSHRWMTLGQIKRLMRRDNLVNMDTRTVLSCIPFAGLRLAPWEADELRNLFSDGALFRSIFPDGDGAGAATQRVYSHINDWKMFHDAQNKLVPLLRLKDWEMRDGEFVCRAPFPFKVVFCDVSIEGREVRHWAQPLVETNGPAMLGLLLCETDGMLKFLVRAKPEVGCMDGVELGPTVQWEAGTPCPEDALSRFFIDRAERGSGVKFDHLLSEDGGRFYHEQNRNILLKAAADELPPLPAGCFLLDYRTLNRLVQSNNVLNIQLRDLLALLEALI